MASAAKDSRNGASRRKIQIRGELLRVISNLEINMLIFSKDYASSSRCRLASMVQHWKRDEKVIWLIFKEMPPMLSSKLDLIRGFRKAREMSGEDMAEQRRH